MKNLFKLLFLFFITMVVFFVQPSDFQLKEIQAEAAIQAVASENFVLVSNSFQSGEIYSYQEELSPNSLGNYFYCYTSSYWFPIRKRDGSLSLFIEYIRLALTAKGII